MEDAVTANAPGVLLPGGRDVPFAEIEATLAHLMRDGSQRRASPARALTATVVVVAAPTRLVAAADALDQLGEAVGLRAILISEGERTAPSARVTENAIAIAGLAPRFLNNAVAALRLSSLPAVVWWRGGSIDALDGLAVLADRLILDAAEPEEAWSRAAGLLDRTGLTDLRWTALTRWRAALAHLFDLPQVAGGASALDRLEIEAKDVPAARLFAGWIRSRLRWTGRQSIAIRAARSDAASPLVRVTLSGGDVSIGLALTPNLTCLEASVDRVEAATRVVPLGDGTLASLIAEELGVRTRDVAFEQALASAREIRA